MAANAQKDRPQFWSRWRLAAWGSAAGLILLPLFAMQFTDEVKWSPQDFGFAVAMVVGVGAAYEMAVRMTSNRAYRVAVGLALAAASLLIWANAAVGIIGSEDNAVNLWFDAVPALGLVGAALARFRAQAMARAMAATALAQVMVAVAVFVAGFGFTGPVTVFFAAMWLTSAWLFRKAARETMP
ncbi:MAG: hypothetical protein JWR68_1487 [Polaromonas sp.]|nr:hypothetical protein [Polaromonas sp.]